MVFDSIRPSLESTVEEEPASENECQLGLERKNTLLRIVSSFPAPPALHTPKAREFSFSFAFGEDGEDDQLSSSPTSTTSSSVEPSSKKPRLRRSKAMGFEELREARQQAEWDELRRAMEEGVEQYCLGRCM